MSWICADLDEEVGAFRDRSLAGVAYPYVLLDATYCKARVNRRVVSQAVVIATGSVFPGAAWQRCRVQFMRNVLAIVPKGNQEMVAAAIRTIFAQPDAEHVHEQFEVSAERRYLSEGSMALLAEKTPEEVAKPELMAPGPAAPWSFEWTAAWSTWGRRDGPK